MIYIYCKTLDDHKRVGELLCITNSTHKETKNDSWTINYEAEDDCWIIETDCYQSQAAAIIYRIGYDVVCIEVDNKCAPKIIELLMEKYGYDNVKWLSIK